MKIAIFEVQEFEEAQIAQIAEEFHMEVVTTKSKLSVKNVHLAEGCEGVTTSGMSDVNRKVLQQLSQLGVKYLTTRTIGYNHIDIDAAKEYGIKVSNSSYPPYGVAEFTIMLMLLTLRKYKPAMWRQNVNDFSLKGLMGREIKGMTIGVIGTGRIGEAVIRMLEGFDCKVLAYNRRENITDLDYVTYVDLDTLYRESDMITIHLPLFPETRYMINKERIAQMKDGVILINTARGELMDIEALIDGIESEKVGALGLDVIENEQGIYHKNRVADIIQNRDMAYLRQFPNVVLTQHMAFYTQADTQSMTYDGVKGLYDFITTGTNASEVTDR